MGDRQGCRWTSPRGPKRPWLHAALRTCMVATCPWAPLPLSCTQRKRFFQNEPGRGEGASRAPSLEQKPPTGPTASLLTPRHNLQLRPTPLSSLPVPARPGSLHCAPPGPRPFAQAALHVAASSDPPGPPGSPVAPPHSSPPLRPGAGAWPTVDAQRKPAGPQKGTHLHLQPLRLTVAADLLQPNPRPSRISCQAHNKVTGMH